jgi:hypothetical protein
MSCDRVLLLDALPLTASGRWIAARSNSASLRPTPPATPPRA